MDSVTARLPVSPRARHVASVVWLESLVSPGEIAMALGWSIDRVYPAVRELRDAGLVASARLGASGHPAERLWLTQKALEDTEAPTPNWHEEWGRCRLLERLPLATSFYRVAGSVKEMGRMLDFRWLSGMSMDAAVRYECGWAAILWSGLLESENHLLARLQALGPDLEDHTDHSVSHETPWPGLICFVVHDQWQKELVLRAARRYRLQDRVALWCVADDTRSGAMHPGESRGWVHQIIEPRDLGGWPWEDRVRDSIFSMDGRGRVLGTLDSVVQWPGLPTGMVELATGEADPKTAQRRCRALAARGLIGSERIGLRNHHYIKSSGFHILARRDGVSNTRSDMRKHRPPWMKRRASQAHEDGVMSLMSEFMAADIPVAAGWRSWEHLGGHGGISPDGMVLLEQGPYGHGWHYVEYERSARARYRAQRKLRGYSSRRRQDDWPVLLVVWNDRAEQYFWEVGRQNQLVMLTATIGRLAAHHALGNWDCWKMYGEPVRIG